ncbi:transposase IS111A/IS1328/IS1533 [Parafrankia sp. EAN1pec]|uniref:IS110 family transposase n=1 Tax=Parafrankia sp. (strain EAN1pec) TaxID=298653 RepID=UPI00005436D3|nr:transposase IS111A/IS1328/IS1533 [Frankia sp. EAN1pec]
MLVPAGCAGRPFRAAGSVAPCLFSGLGGRVGSVVGLAGAWRLRSSWPVPPVALVPAGSAGRALGPPAGRKSDHGDAVVLANILRTDRNVHRTLPADSEQVQAVAVLARAQQDAVWRCVRAVNELRSLLREYYPAFLEAFAARPAGLADG